MDIVDAGNPSKYKKGLFTRCHPPMSASRQRGKATWHRVNTSDISFWSDVKREEREKERDLLGDKPWLDVSKSNH